MIRALSAFAVLLCMLQPKVLGANPSEHVDLDAGMSPDKQFKVALEADKDSLSYDAQGPPPSLLIVDAKSLKSLVRLPYIGDTNSDLQPLRKHLTVLWSPTSEAVAINFTERHYSYTVLYAWAEEEHAFKEVKLPNYETLTGFPTPKNEDLRPRGSASFLKWTTEGHAIYELIFSAEASYQGNDPLHHMLELSVSSDGSRLVKRLPLPGESE